MDRISDTASNNNVVPQKESCWKTLAGLFFVQFLLSPLFMCYGLYSLFLELNGLKIHQVLWTPAIFAATYKICKPWCRDIAESFSERYFRLFSFVGTMSCVLGISLNYFNYSLVYRSVFYGGLAGFGTSLTLCMIESRLFDIFQYQSTLIYSIKHLSAALALFIVPHLLYYIYIRLNHTKFVFLYHGAFLLHAIPASFMFGKPNFKSVNDASKVNYIWGIAENREGEIVDMSENGRNWKNPSEKHDHFEIHEDLEHELPAPHQKCTLGVEIMPEILEENEEDVENDQNKRSSILDKDIKRLSVISSKLEEIIERNDYQDQKRHQEICINFNQNGATVSYGVNFDPNAAIFQKSQKIPENTCCCLSEYQRFRFKRRLKSFFDQLMSLTCTPLITTLKIINFYPCWFSVTHSMFSPLIFLNFMPILANEDLQFGDISEISFMISMVAFAYICFLITLPWIAEISKRKMRYLYIMGAFISAISFYVIVRNIKHDFMTVSCLVYGAGLGIEAYSLEIVVKEYLGVKHWTKVEGTLDSISGISLIGILLIINKVFSSLEKNKYVTVCLRIAMYSHLLIFIIWIIFPFINNIKHYIREEHHKRFIQQQKNLQNNQQL